MEEDFFYFDEDLEGFDPNRDALDDLHAGWLSDIAHNNGE